MRKEKFMFTAVVVLMVVAGLFALDHGMSLAQDETTVEKMELFTGEQEKDNITEQPFQVLVSGIDDYAGQKGKGRSDLDLLLTVNPVTKKILATNTERDMYVTYPDETDEGKAEKDKLCHINLYGVDMLIKSVEDLYDTQIDYFVQIDLSGFVRLVDAIGGIDVECKKSFQTDWGTTYEKGENHLNGKEALAFARERHHLKKGSMQRCENQQILFQAIFEKVMTKSVFEMDVDTLYHVWKENVKTDMKMGEVVSLIKMQLAGGEQWDYAMYTLKGEGDLKPVFSVPDVDLFVVIPKEKSLEKAKNKIKDVMK